MGILNKKPAPHLILISHMFIWLQSSAMAVVIQSYGDSASMDIYNNNLLQLQVVDYISRFFCIGRRPDEHLTSCNPDYLVFVINLQNDKAPITDF